MRILQSNSQKQKRMEVTKSELLGEQTCWSKNMKFNFRGLSLRHLLYIMVTLIDENISDFKIANCVGFNCSQHTHKTQMCK